KKVAQRTLEGGEVVWFGCDVDKQLREDPGVWDARLYEFDALYGAEFSLSKAERLRCGQTLMTHAMVFTGVDVVGGRPRRWRVENSYGSAEGTGQKGFYTMNDNWFDEYVFEISAHRKLLTAELRKALEKKPVELPPWDPMGALA
ncbi:MAG: aminopeptidase, partial [Phycisphaeraceae bacterium]|nr:aminopeptidase [Phycisphaeraceae bacterium]